MRSQTNDWKRLLDFYNALHFTFRHLTLREYAWLYCAHLQDKEFTLKVTFALPIFYFNKRPFSIIQVDNFLKENNKKNIKGPENTEASDLAAFWELGARRGRSWEDKEIVCLSLLVENYHSHSSSDNLNWAIWQSGHDIDKEVGRVILFKGVEFGAIWVNLVILLVSAWLCIVLLYFEK